MTIPDKPTILQELYDTGFIPAYCRTVNRGKYNDTDIEDIEQEVWLIVCSMPEERLQFLYNQGKGINGVRRFCSGIISRQINSVTSPIYRTYKRMPYDCIGDISDIEYHEKVREEEKNFLLHDETHFGDV